MRSPRAALAAVQQPLPRQLGDHAAYHAPVSRRSSRSDLTMRALAVIFAATCAARSLAKEDDAKWKYVIPSGEAKKCVDARRAASS